MVRVVVLSGEGRSFCAGLDTSSFARTPDTDEPKLTDRTHGDSNKFQQVATIWRKLPMPVIAALHGVCFGGEMQIASGADIRVAAPDTRMAIMEMKWGLVPDMGGYQLWRGLVRPPPAVSSPTKMTSGRSCLPARAACMRSAAGPEIAFSFLEA